MAKKPKPDYAARPSVAAILSMLKTKRGATGVSSRKAAVLDHGNPASYTCATHQAYSIDAAIAPFRDYVPNVSPIWSTESKNGMTIQAHLAALEQRHDKLDQEIAEALAHSSSDDLKIAELKRRKLQLKDEIGRLQRGDEAALSGAGLKK